MSRGEGCHQATGSHTQSALSCCRTCTRSTGSAVRLGGVALARDNVAPRRRSLRVRTDENVRTGCSCSLNMGCGRQASGAPFQLGRLWIHRVIHLSVHRAGESDRAKAPKQASATSGKPSEVSDTCRGRRRSCERRGQGSVAFSSVRPREKSSAANRVCVLGRDLHLSRHCHRCRSDVLGDGLVATAGPDHRSGD